MDPFEKRGMEEKGAAHVFAALGYSINGLKVLLREEAARLECVVVLVAAVSFWVLGASWVQIGILLALFMALLLVEALNTAIELIIDKTSPEISDYAKQAKDLGSFAVFCMLVIFGGFAGFVVMSLLVY